MFTKEIFVGGWYGKKVDVDGLKEKGVDDGAVYGRDVVDGGR